MTFMPLQNVLAAWLESGAPLPTLNLAPFDTVTVHSIRSSGLKHNRDPEKFEPSIRTLKEVVRNLSGQLKIHAPVAFTSKEVWRSGPISLWQIYEGKRTIVIDHMYSEQTKEYQCRTRGSVSNFSITDTDDIEIHTLSTVTGFLPDDLSSTRLPQYYDAWEDLCDILSTAIPDRTIGLQVDRLNILETNHLRTDRDWRRAYSVLSYLVSAYVWTGDTPKSIIPPALAEPLLIICEHVEMPPVITYTALILWNIKLVAGANSEYNLDNLDVCRSFTGTPDERWFHMICAAIEAKAGPAIERILLANNAVATNNPLAVTNSLIFVQHTIQHLTSLLQELNNRVNPTIWYEKLRPYLAGGIDDRLTQGISFDNGKTYLKLAGANAGQSSLFQFFDAALGIAHSTDFAARMRMYMPGPHARFLQATEDNARIRSFVLNEVHDKELQEAYNSCVKALEVFRSKHIQIVSRYIVIPARGAARKKGDEGACRGEGEMKEELRGVGGAPLMPFLRGMRDETRQSSVAE